VIDDGELFGTDGAYDAGIFGVVPQLVHFQRKTAVGVGLGDLLGGKSHAAHVDERLVRASVVVELLSNVGRGGEGVFNGLGKAGLYVEIEDRMGRLAGGLHDDADLGRDAGGRSGREDIVGDERLVALVVDDHKTDRIFGRGGKIVVCLVGGSSVETCADLGFVGTLDERDHHRLAVVDDRIVPCLIAHIDVILGDVVVGRSRDTCCDRCYVADFYRYAVLGTGFLGCRELDAVQHVGQLFVLVAVCGEDDILAAWLDAYLVGDVKGVEVCFAVLEVDRRVAVAAHAEHFEILLVGVAAHVEQQFVDVREEE
jgi:hypothetical protein